MTLNKTAVPVLLALKLQMSFIVVIYAMLAVFHQLISCVHMSSPSSPWLTHRGGHPRRGNPVGQPQGIAKIDSGTILGPHPGPPKTTRIPITSAASTRIGTVPQGSKRHRVCLLPLYRPKVTWTVVKSMAKQCSERLHRRPGVLSMVWLVRAWN